MHLHSVAVSIFTIISKEFGGFSPRGGCFKHELSFQYQVSTRHFNRIPPRVNRKHHSSGSAIHSCIYCEIGSHHGRPLNPLYVHHGHGLYSWGAVVSITLEGAVSNPISVSITLFFIFQKCFGRNCFILYKFNGVCCFGWFQKDYGRGTILWIWFWAHSWRVCWDPTVPPKEKELIDSFPSLEDKFKRWASDMKVTRHN